MTLAPLIQASPAIQIHVIGAVLSMIGAAILLLGKKGTARHKLIGKLWVGAMAVTAISSFNIHAIRMVGDYSPIHILSILTLIGLYQIVWFARKKQIVKHLQSVNSLIFGALGVAGTFAFLPDRILNAVFFGGGSYFGFIFVASTVLILWLIQRGSKKRFSRFTY